ncbi:MAG: hypothetical protein AB7F88_19775 [Pyrinomonadaceae bacterium]
MTRVKPLPPEAEILTDVNRALPPGDDDAAAALARLVLTLANPEDNETWALANAAARQAYLGTVHFQKALQDFAGVDRERYCPDAEIREICQTQ